MTTGWEFFSSVILKLQCLGFFSFGAESAMHVPHFFLKKKMTKVENVAIVLGGENLLAVIFCRCAFLKDKVPWPQWLRTDVLLACR